MSHATFHTSDLTAFCHLDELGLVAVGQRIEPDRAVVECHFVERDPWCRRCGAEARSRGSLARRLSHDPFGLYEGVTLVTRVWTRVAGDGV